MELTKELFTMVNSSNTQPFEIELSSAKAMRSYMLKTRYTYIILKSQNFLAERRGCTVYNKKIRLAASISRSLMAPIKKTSRQERDHTKTASQYYDKTEHTRLVRDRTKARTALHVIKKSDDIYESVDMLKDLELWDCGFLYYENVSQCLERLGLHIEAVEFIEDEEVRFHIKESKRYVFFPNNILKIK